MKVLVTGAGGCIGAWIVKQLLERAIDVVTYDADPEPVRLRRIADPRLLRNLQLTSGRIEDTEAIRNLVRDEQITHIIHLAAVLMPFCQQNPVAGGMVNVIGTLNVFQAARDAGRPVRVVYASSSAVWGPEDAYEDRKLTEDDPLKPATHYGVFKQANEGNARVFFTSDGISSAGLRPWAVYGYGRDAGLTADPSLALRALARKEPFHIRLSGSMDMQYVEDVAAIFIACLLSDQPGAHAFNLAGHLIEMPALVELYERIRPGAASLITSGGAVVQVAKRMDDSALRAYLGHVPETPLEDGIRRTLEFFENET